MRLKYLFAILLLAFTVTGCSIKHPVAIDYERYLKNTEGTAALPETNLDADYFLTKETQEHRYEFRAATVGVANLWIVEFGKMLDATLESNDIQIAFGKLTKISDETDAGENLILFDLEDYQFYDFAAHVSLNITLKNNGKKVFSETYIVKGQPQGGKMFWGGALAMKNAIFQSTQYALNQIMHEFIDDVNEQAKQ